MDIVYHYPPDLMQSLIDTIPLLSRSKEDVLLFFRGAGVGSEILSDLEARIRADRDGVKKQEIAREVIKRLNERGERSLRERREIIKRVTEFEDFSTCWSGDQLKAKGLVAAIRQSVGVKDSFTRMQQAQESEREQRLSQQREQQRRVEEKRLERAEIKRQLFALFSERDPQARGKALEGVLNRLFASFDLLVKEAFTRSEDGAGVVEQIDGVVGLDGEIYLVEMKWWSNPLGPTDIYPHLGRIFNRGCARGILVSASPYTAAAVSACREALQRTVIVLCQLEELVRLLEEEADLKDFLRNKIQAAILDKNPLHEPLASLP